jgi:hypothetical protein
MRWGTRNARPSMRGDRDVANWWRAMKVYAAFIMSLSVALTLASSQAFGGSGLTPGGVSAPHSTFHRSVTRSQHLHHGRNRGTFFPGSGGFFWGPSNSQPNAEVTPPPSGLAADINYTYKFDVPWDWVHRYPPSWFASPPEPTPPPIPFVRGCPAETVTVPGADGKDQTITMVRC